MFRVCCRSPIIPARTTLTGDVFNFSTGSDNEMGNSNYWRNPMSASTDSVASLSKYNKVRDLIKYLVKFKINLNYRWTDQWMEESQLQIKSQIPFKKN